MAELRPSVEAGFHSILKNMLYTLILCMLIFYVALRKAGILQIKYSRKANGKNCGFHVNPGFLTLKIIETIKNYESKRIFPEIILWKIMAL